MSRHTAAHPLVFDRRLDNPTNNHINQLGLFSYTENLIQRALAVSSSSVSILACLLAMYAFLAMDRNRLVFRHQLIAFLILFDLLKACILLLYPSRVMTHGSAYLNQRFCQVVGFFTSVAIEGADLAILSFAVHTFLLIFQPRLLVTIPGSDRVEGGLYKYRYYVYGLSFVIPVVMASLAYIGVGYSSFVCWCYLPQHPVWYRLVLSWVPRYLIVVVIFLVYGLIYYHVLKEFKALGGYFSHMHRQHLRSLRSKNYNTVSFFSSLSYAFGSAKRYLADKFVVPSHLSRSSSACDSWLAPQPSRARQDSPKAESQTHSSGDGNTPNESRGNTPPPVRSPSPAGPLDPADAIHDPELHAANLENFRRRQKAIEKQMKSIFVYPFAYVAVWLFPFILQCTQFNYESSHKPVHWLNYLGAFMQPFNGFVDSLVFFYREEPWNYTIMKLFERDAVFRMDLQPGNYSVSYADTDSSNTYPKGTTPGANIINVDHYPRWRRILAMLRLPFMELPTADAVARLRADYMARMEEQRNDPPAGSGGDFQGVLAQQQGPADFSALTMRHDFSNLLSGEIMPAGGDCAVALDRYSLNFSRGNRLSVSGMSGASGGSPDSAGRRGSVTTASNKSNRSRRPSAMDPRETIPEQTEFAPVAESVAPGRKAYIKRPLQRSRGSGSDDNMDFLEFLRS